MNKKIAAVIVSALVALQAGSAMAETRVYIGTPGGQVVMDERGRPDDRRGDRDGWDRGRPGGRDHDGPRGHRPPPPPPRVVIRERDRHDDFTAGMMGFIGGIAAGSALDNGGRIPVVRQYRYEPYRDRYEPRRQLLRPWSSAWYRWCDARYRSFDPRTGTYRDRDGSVRFCEARG